MLKGRRVSADALRHFKKVKPVRQIEMAEMMVAANNITTSYVKCMVAATAPDQLADPETPKAVKGIHAADMARMEREVTALERDFKSVKQDYGDNMLNLVVSVGYLRRMLDNTAVVRYLSRHHADILAEFERIAEATSIKQGA